MGGSGHTVRIVEFWRCVSLLSQLTIDPRLWFLSQLTIDPRLWFPSQLTIDPRL
jgi:hypothetical protein